MFQSTERSKLGKREIIKEFWLHTHKKQQGFQVASSPRYSQYFSVVSEHYAPRYFNASWYAQSPMNNMYDLYLVSKQRPNLPKLDNKVCYLHVHLVQIWDVILLRVLNQRAHGQDGSKAV